MLAEPSSGVNTRINFLIDSGVWCTACGVWCPALLTSTTDRNYIFLEALPFFCLNVHWQLSNEGP